MNIRKSLIIFTGCIMALVSCEKSEISNLQTKDNPTELDGRIEIGKKLENPYSLNNMKEAYNNLRAKDILKSAGSADQLIEATHFYVRFLPQDSMELNILEKDTTLELFDYPLDHEITEEGNFYHDPEIPEEKPTWQYTAVPVDYQFPDMKYEIIEECFMPEEDEDETLKSAKNDINFALLEAEAFQITGNIQEYDTDETRLKGLFPKKKEPKGTIQVANTTTGQLEGISGIKVRVHRFTKIGTAYTNESGYYHVKKGFRYGVHYALIFENSSGFKIWGNWAFLAPHRYNMGWHSRSGYNRQIWTNSSTWKVATVNNAVFKYRKYCDEFSISKPPSDLRVWVFEKNDGSTTGSASMLRRTWGLYGFTSTSKLATFFSKANSVSLSVNLMAALTKFAQPDITISVNTGSVTTANVYQTTFHECAHASHWTKVGSSYWVKYINYIITYGSKENPYGNGTGQNAGYCGVGEMWGNYIGALFVRQEFISRWPYNSTTAAGRWSWFIENEDWYNPGFLKDVDNIADITTSEIFSCMTSNTNTINKMVEQLKTKTENDGQIDNAYNSPRYNDWP